VDGNTATRIYVPPKVGNLIVRQRDQLAGTARSRTAKAIAAQRKLAGYIPTFGGKRGKRKSRK
jgi:hypothetical protein